jgi:hypothetical protein
MEPPGERYRSGAMYIHPIVLWLWLLMDPDWAPLEFKLEGGGGGFCFRRNMEDIRCMILLPLPPELLPLASSQSSSIGGEEIERLDHTTQHLISITTNPIKTHYPTNWIASLESK